MSQVSQLSQPSTLRRVSCYEQATRKLPPITAVFNTLGEAHPHIETPCTVGTTPHDHSKRWSEDIGGQVSTTGERSDAACVGADLSLTRGWVFHGDVFYEPYAGL